MGEAELENVSGNVQPPFAAARQLRHRGKFPLRQERGAVALDQFLLNMASTQDEELEQKKLK